MCNYQPYINSCGHGTELHPALHTIQLCKPPSPDSTLCPQAFLAPTLSTGFPCWTCHKAQMLDIGDRANIYAYSAILDAVRYDGLGRLSPGEVGYYALLTGRPRADGGLRPLGSGLGIGNGGLVRVETQDERVFSTLGCSRELDRSAQALTK